MAAETLEPRSISLTSSVRLVGTPARCISVMASPALVSRRRQRSMMAVVNLIPLSLGMRIVASPEVVASFRSQRPAPTRSSASSSSGPFSISSTVLRMSSFRSALGDSSFSVTMGSGMACLQ